MSCFFPKLPSDFPLEVFSQILLQLLVCDDTLSLARCLRCNKAWYNAGTPMLYRNVLLTQQRLSYFVENFNHCNSTLVRTLTVSLDPLTPEADAEGLYLEDPQHIRDHGNSRSKDMGLLLEQLPSHIETMKNLLVFSLSITPKPFQMGFWIPRAIIADILSSLAESCTSVEIDTRGAGSPEQGSAHLCDQIREMLPRLRHLRLRLTSMCPLLFGQGFSRRKQDDRLANFKPSSAPHLETLSLNCIMTSIFGRGPHICDASIENELKEWSSDCLVAALCLAHEASCFPAAKSISVLNSSRRFEALTAIPPSYPYFLKSEILQMAAWAMPFANIAPLQDGFLVRVPGNLERLGAQWSVQALAEGEAWVETESGVRVPVSIYDRSIATYPRRLLPLLTGEAWRIANPRKMCQLWVNEKLCGVQLLKAERMAKIFQPVPVTEETPHGFIRFEGGFLHRSGP